MSWIEYHTPLRDHWKIKRLSLILEVDYLYALGAISCLWLWCADYAQDGDLRRFSDDEIRDAARCNLQKFSISALKNCQLINEKGKINDWSKYGIKLLESNRKRVREHRLQKHYRNVTVMPTNQPNQPYQPNQLNTINPLPVFDCEAPVVYLNLKTKRSFDPKNKATREIVLARYKEGRTLEQFRKVVDVKVGEWFTDEKMSKFLRPSTLFNRTNFENYLNQPVPRSKSSIENFIKE